MSSELHNLSDYDADSLPGEDDLMQESYAIVVADWNSKITYALAEGAIKTLEKHGVYPENIRVVHVPGTFELTYAAAKLQKMHSFDAIMVIGCVIQGETPHFIYICEGVANGITHLNADSNTPVIFSVLTTLNQQQAEDRAGGKLGNKGIEGAITGIKMANIF